MEFLRALVVVLFTWSVYKTSTNEAKCGKRVGLYVAQRHQALSGHTIMNRSRTSRVLCAVLCHIHDHCLSFNHDKTSGICQLNDAKKDNFATSLQQHGAFSYYESQDIATEPTRMNTVPLDATPFSPGSEEIATTENYVTSEDEEKWNLFWWYKANTTWPALVTDVLQDRYGGCNSSAPYCFSRLPEFLEEASAEMLGRDSAGNVYRWRFDPGNDVAHAVWQAFHDHEQGHIKDGDMWNPVALKGSPPHRNQDSFQYRPEHGVASLLIDDTTCDCYTSLSMGHGICLGGFNADHGPENVYGVDLLFDNGCQTPSPVNGLFLYFRGTGGQSGVSDQP